MNDSRIWYVLAAILVLLIIIGTRLQVVPLASHPAFFVINRWTGSVELCSYAGRKELNRIPPNTPQKGE